MSLRNKLTNSISEATNLINRIKNEELLLLTIRNRGEVLFEGRVKAISSQNEIGLFDVLPQHANFITIIKENLTIIKSNEEKQTFQLKTGLLKVWENEALVFLDILSPLKV